MLGLLRSRLTEQDVAPLQFSRSDAEVCLQLVTLLLVTQSSVRFWVQVL